MDKMVKYANGYYYIGDYQPFTSTGRYDSREDAVQHQMDCYDMGSDSNEN